MKLASSIFTSASNLQFHWLQMVSLNNLDRIMLGSFGFRDFIFKLTLEGKVTSLPLCWWWLISATPTCLLCVFLLPVCLLSSVNGVLMMLRMFVATRISSLITRHIQLSGKNWYCRNVEHLLCNTDLSKMITIMKLVLFADTGELARAFVFHQVCGSVDYIEIELIGAEKPIIRCHWWSKSKI